MLGFAGSIRLVYNFLQTPRGNRRTRPLIEVVPPSPVEQFSARNAVWLFIRDPAQFSAQEQEQLALIRASSTSAETADGLVQDFLTMVHKREGERLDAWIEAVQASQIPELHRFVNGILKDKDAVVAGLTLAYSNGPVEAQVQKLKFGQAFDVWSRETSFSAATLAQCGLIGTDTLCLIAFTRVCGQRIFCSWRVGCFTSA